MSAQADARARQVATARGQVALDPARAEKLQQLGLALTAVRGAAAAVPGLRRASWLAPGDPDLLVNLGIALIEAGGHAEAGRVFRRVLVLLPADADAQHGAGVADSGCGHQTDAEARLRRALLLRPGYAETMVRLAGVLIRLDHLAEAIVLERRALVLAPGRGPAHVDLGVAFEKGEDREQALRCFRRAIACDPGDVQARVNASASLATLGRTGEAVAMLRAAATIPGAGPGPYRNLLAVMSYAAVDEDERWETTRAFAVRYAPSAALGPPTNARDPERPLVVGYLSSDLYEHPVARNLAPILEARGAGSGRTICYAASATSDAMTRRLRSAVDLWRQVETLSDEEIARRIRADAVDILVVVGGRFDRNRPLVAAWRAAPVQISLFDGGTSGIDAMGYLLADRLLVAPARVRRERYVERVLRLPSLYAHLPFDEVPVATEPPCLRKGYVTFGCFNSPMKLGDDALRVWAEVLRAVPTARLRLKYQARYRDPFLRRRIAERLPVDPARIEFVAGGEQVGTHLRSYDDVDIALDPFPFTGSTTTWESLWMGVPVTTLLGPALVGRLTASFLAQAGLGELVATTPEGYVRIATGLAASPSRLAELRASLRGRVARSPLADGAGKARRFERIFRAVWRRWCGAGVFGGRAAPVSARAAAGPGGAGSGR